MKIKIIAKPAFCFSLTLAQIAVLISLSARHYDPTCRAAGQPTSHLHGIYLHRGFLQDWKQLLEFTSDQDDFDHISASWREIDVVLKILEGRSGHLERATADTLFDIFSALLRASSPVVATWKAEFDTTIGSL